MNKKVKGYKGFDKEFKCREFQFEAGKSYEHDGDVLLCNAGFHFVINPLDAFGYYAPAESRFAEIEAEGVSSETGKDSKRVAKKITIVKELTLSEMSAARIAQIDWSKANNRTASGDRGAATASGDRGAATASGDSGAATASGDSGAATASGYSGAATASGYSGAATASGDRGAATASGSSGAATASGDSGAATASGDSGAATASGYSGAATASGSSGAATASGYRGAATASGYRGAATASGDRGAATASGNESCACALGAEGMAKGIVGTWLTIAEWEIRDVWHRIDVQTVKVDGKKIKPDTFYRLVGGKFVEIK